MMQLEVGGKRYPIAAGETVIGASPDCAVTLQGDGVRPRHAMLYGSPAGTAIRTAAPEAGILVNGVLLGGDPTPVLHGDKIQIGPHELLVVDPERVGQTRRFDSRVFEELAVPRGIPETTRAVTGGRLVCLTDGREYLVGDQLVFGRDAGADVVVTGHEVSRHHATIRRTAEGYVLTDSSANGTRVNGGRIDRMHLLARSDIIRIGDDEFRFYADTRPPAAGSFSSGSPISPATPLASANYHRSDAARGASSEAQPPRAMPPRLPMPLASMLIRSGEHKGRRLPVRAAVATVGRADYNDVVIADPSVSAEHAKLRRREGLWIIADAGSTNGTYVDGELVTEEMPLLPGASVRFGEVTVCFESYDESERAVPAAGTRVMDRIDVPVPVSRPPLVPEPVVEPPPVVFRSVTPEPVREPVPVFRPVIADSVTEPLPVAASEPVPASSLPDGPESAIDVLPLPRQRVTPRGPEIEASYGTMVWLVVAVVAAAAAGIAAGFLILR